jgi:acyl-CoA hydrolase
MSKIRMIKSRRMRWAGHVARMGRSSMHIRIWWESQKERDHQEDHGTGMWIILKWILER